MPLDKHAKDPRIGLHHTLAAGDDDGPEPRQELEALPGTIERLETQIATLTEAMHDPTFFQREAAAIVAHNTKLADTQAELDKTYARWMELDAG